MPLYRKPTNHGKATATYCSHCHQEVAEFWNNERDESAEVSEERAFLLHLTASAKCKEAELKTPKAKLAAVETIPPPAAEPDTSKKPSWFVDGMVRKGISFVCPDCGEKAHFKSNLGITHKPGCAFKKVEALSAGG